MPTPIVLMCVACAVLLIGLLTVPPVKRFIHDQVGIPSSVVLAFAAFAPLVLIIWYALTFAEVRRGRFRVRSLRGGGPGVNLKQLTAADVHAKSRSGSKRQRFELILRLEDAAGNEAWLPLNSWQDEDLLMARVLRATVERRVRIEGDPMLVRRFSGLLDTYKSWDRQQAAA